MVELGYARRQLARAADGEFDVIIMDAFCSDAIPVHLLTREAVQLYLRKLAPDGVLAMHVSNVHLDVHTLVARLAADHDPPLCCRYCHDLTTDKDKADGKSDSQWVVLSRSEAEIGHMVGWQPHRSDGGPIWRDDFANLLWVWKPRNPDG